MVVADAPALVESTAAWRRATRLAFRFSVVYFSLYVLCTQMLPTLMPGINRFGSLEEHPPVRIIVSWTAAHLFRVTTPLVITGSGSGDKTFDWVEAFCTLIAAAAAALIWSAVDRRRGAYPSLFKWFRVFVRFSLGSTMFVYGFGKIVPLQMGYGASFVAGKPMLLLNKPNDKAWHAEFTYEELARDRLVLDGTMDQHAIHAELQLADPDSFLLRSRGFHWIQEYPFNR